HLVAVGPAHHAGARRANAGLARRHGISRSAHLRAGAAVLHVAVEVGAGAGVAIDAAGAAVLGRREHVGAGVIAAVPRCAHRLAIDVHLAARHAGEST